MSNQFAAALSVVDDTSAALNEVLALASQQLDGEPTLALLFFTAPHAPRARDLLPEFQQRLGARVLLGCSAESVASTGVEVEMAPAISLWVASLPNTTLWPMHLEFQRTPEGGTLVGWPDKLPEPWPSDAAMLALGDPFSFPAELLLERVNDEHAGAPVIGGMASAASQPGENVLVWDGATYSTGAVAVLLSGGVRVHSVVSQGCRPIGGHYVITGAERNVIKTLGGAPAYQRLAEVYKELATSEQALVRRGLHVGRVVNEYQDHFEQGDFLVRNVVGVDQQEGFIAIGDYVRPGQTVQFHVRDATTADAELRQLLATQRDHAARAALLFTCNGRGTRLFPDPHHDATCARRVMGDIPLAGFFAAGELGPIGGKNFVHGFTASLALFSDK